MTEKGVAKGFSVGKGGKSISSPKDASLKGKDDESTKSKKGRKVQFNDEGDWSKGGKGGKTASVGKSSTTKETSKYDLNMKEDLPKNAQCLMDCEAADILQGIQERMVILSRDPTIKLPAAFDKGLQYAKAGAQHANPVAVKQALQALKKHGVCDGEICVIANTCPESIDETFALVPTLKSKRSQLTEVLKDVLGKLEDLKCSTETL